MARLSSCEQEEYKMGHETNICLKTIGMKPNSTNMVSCKYMINFRKKYWFNFFKKKKTTSFKRTLKGKKNNNLEDNNHNIQK